MNDEEIKEASLDQLRQRFGHLNSLILIFSATSKDEDEAIAIWDEIQKRERKAGLHVGKKKKGQRK